MSVYVDSAYIPYRGMLMCHLLADSLEELHSMADRIGIQRRWFQGSASTPHYDVCKSKRALAIKHGAIAIDRSATVEVCSRWREKGKSLKADATENGRPFPKLIEDEQGRLESVTDQPDGGHS